jgi:hypothetical protein
MDYSYNEVNQNSLPLAPFSVMQFGHTFQHLLQHIAYCNPAFGPPLLAKIDMADGYYRIPLTPDASLQLAVCLPSDGSTLPLLGIPLSLPMGWSLSPPFFCAFTETCADVTNMVPVPHSSHPFHNAATPQIPTPTQEHFDDTAILPYNPKPPNTPLATTGVYIDDFLLAAQRPRHKALMDTLLHHLNTMFQDPDISPCRAILSASKVQKRDATFSTTKNFLGWEIDTCKMSVHLPQHRLERLDALLNSMLTTRFTM